MCGLKTLLRHSAVGTRNGSQATEVTIRVGVLNHMSCACPPEFRPHRLNSTSQE